MHEIILNFKDAGKVNELQIALDQYEGLDTDVDRGGTLMYLTFLDSGINLAGIAVYTFLKIWEVIGTRKNLQVKGPTGNTQIIRYQNPGEPPSEKGVRNSLKAQLEKDSKQYDKNQLAWFITHIRHIEIQEEEK